MKEGTDLYKHPFLYFGIFSLEMSSATIPQISPLLHSGLRIFVLTIQKDQATRTEEEGTDLGYCSTTHFQRKDPKIQKGMFIFFLHVESLFFM
jgi:hypothetical protein